MQSKPTYIKSVSCIFREEELRNNMRKSKLVKGIAMMLAVSTIATSITSEVYADGVGDAGGNTDKDSGGSYSGGGSGGSYFCALQTGYRFYIVDGNGNRVSNTLDVCNEDPYLKLGASTAYTYTNAYNEGLSNNQSNYKMYTWGELQSKVTSLQGHIPPAPLEKPTASDPYPDASYATRGDQFKQWVINGIGGSSLEYLMGNLAADTATANPNRTTSSGGSGSNTSSSLSGGTGGSGISNNNVKFYYAIQLFNG